MNEFHKSSYSFNNGCVEVGEFRKSPHSTTNGCVEVKGGSMTVLVRDSKNKTGDGTILRFSPEDWESEVIDRIKSGDFNWNTFLPLQFDDGERRAFTLAILDGEFNTEKV